MKNFEKIKEIRKANKLTQTEFGKKLNVSRSYVAQLEGDKTIPSDKLLKKICNVFKLSLNYFEETNPFYDKSEVNMKGSVIANKGFNVDELSEEMKYVWYTHINLNTRRMKLLSLAYILKEKFNYDFPQEDKDLFNSIDSISDYLYKIFFFNAPANNIKIVKDSEVLEKTDDLIELYSIRINSLIAENVRKFKDLFIPNIYDNETPF